MDFAEEYGLNNGLKSVRLDTFSKNDRTISFTDLEIIFNLMMYFFQIKVSSHFTAMKRF